MSFDKLTWGVKASFRSYVEAMVGLFINTLPVRIQVPDDIALPAWLRQIQAEQAAAGSDASKTATATGGSAPSP